MWGHLHLVLFYTPILPKHTTGPQIRLEARAAALAGLGYMGGLRSAKVAVRRSGGILGAIGGLGVGLLQNLAQNYKALIDYTQHRVPPRPWPRSAVPSLRTLPTPRVRFGSATTGNRAIRHRIRHSVSLYALPCLASQRIGNLWGHDLRPDPAA
jgi:hypothetical protein